MHNKPLVLMLVLLAAADVAVSWALFHKFGIHEMNVLAGWLSERLGLVALLGVKCIFVALAVGLCEKIEREAPPRGRDVLIFGVVSHALVVALGLSLLRWL